VQPRNEERTHFDPGGSIERHRAWLHHVTSRSSDAARDAWSLMHAHVEDADPRTRGVASRLTSTASPHPDALNIMRPAPTPRRRQGVASGDMSRLT
jgi:hypothetical protein